MAELVAAAVEAVAHHRHSWNGYAALTAVEEEAAAVAVAASSSTDSYWETTWAGPSCQSTAPSARIPSGKIPCLAVAANRTAFVQTNSVASEGRETWSPAADQASSASASSALGPSFAAAWTASSWLPHSADALVARLQTADAAARPVAMDSERPGNVPPPSHAVLPWSPS